MQRWRWYLLLPVLAMSAYFAWVFWPSDAPLPYEPVSDPPRDAAPRDAEADATPR